MKDSGIEWIGVSSANWNFIKGKYLFEQRCEKGNYRNLQLLSPTQKYGVIPQAEYEKITGMRAVKLNEHIDLNQLKTIHKGDYCISLRSFQGGFEYSEYEGVVSPAYQVFYKKCSISNGFYKYLFKDNSFINKMNSYTMSLRDGKNIAFSDFGNTYLPVPPIDEQNKIANYLDKKCGEIDALTAEIQEQINTLEEYLNSLITETVTAGTNKNNPIEIINSEWLKQKPANWAIKKLKYLFSFEKGLNITKENLVQEGIPVISYGQIHSKINKGLGIKDELVRFVPDSYLRSNKQSLVNEGDFIFADTSEDIDGAGNCVYVDKEMQLFAGYHTIILKNKHKNKFISEYLSYLFKTPLWRMQIRSRVTGIKVFSISQKVLREITVLVPTIEEQIAVVKNLNKKCQEIYNIISDKQKQIETLEEYKKTLIYEYVTGKKEVA